MIALNVLHVKNMKIHLANVSRHNSNGEKQIIFLMILNGQGWNHITVKILSALLRKTTPKHDDVFYLNCLHSFRTKDKLKSPATVCKNKDFCSVAILSEDSKILEFNQYQKSGKASFYYLCRY